MNDTLEAPLAPQPSVFKMYRSLVGVGVLCGLLIVSVFELTKPIIKENRRVALQQAVFKVIPDATESKTFRYTRDGTFDPLPEGESADGPQDKLAYAGYDDSGRLVGLALEAQGMGYQDVITILYGYSFEKDAIVGIKVLESKETPGLGDKIETDPTFLANFEALDVSLNAAGDALAHPIEAVKSGEKENPWEIDSITGATISSKAISQMLRDNAAQWIPIIERREADFEQGGRQDG